MAAQHGDAPSSRAGDAQAGTAAARHALQRDNQRWRAIAAELALQIAVLQEAAAWLFDR